MPESIDNLRAELRALERELKSFNKTIATLIGPQSTRPRGGGTSATQRCAASPPKAISRSKNSVRTARTFVDLATVLAGPPHTK
jgi:hypothetical protein